MVCGQNAMNRKFLAITYLLFEVKAVYFIQTNAFLESFLYNRRYKNKQLL